MAPFCIVVFVFIWFWIFGWLGQRVAPFCSCELDTGAGWESIPLRSSRARVSLSLDTVEDVMVGEIDELEEDVG